MMLRRVTNANFGIATMIIGSAGEKLLITQESQNGHFNDVTNKNNKCSRRYSLAEYPNHHSRNVDFIYYLFN